MPAAATDPSGERQVPVDGPGLTSESRTGQQLPPPSVWYVAESGLRAGYPASPAERLCASLAIRAVAGRLEIQSERAPTRGGQTEPHQVPLADATIPGPARRMTVSK